MDKDINDTMGSHWEFNREVADNFQEGLFLNMM